jgi:hypothetical protein
MISTTSSAVVSARVGTARAGADVSSLGQENYRAAPIWAALPVLVSSRFFRNCSMQTLR